VYEQCVARDSALPPTLLGLAARVEDAAQDSRYRCTRPGRSGAFRWQAFLEATARAAARDRWRRGATEAARHRVGVMAGEWVSEHVELRGVLASRYTYLVAVRMRFGLPVARALLTAAQEQCAHVKRDGGRCAARLDEAGHNAVACGAGGGFVRRHNGIVWALAAELRRLGLHVRTEVWLEDLYEVVQGRVREARMDLVVHTPGGVAYLDVTCYHPFTRAGARRTHAAGGSLAAQEARKHSRYVVREAVTQRRQTRAHFIPVVVSTFGRVGGEATEWFAGLEAEARRRKLGVAESRPGWLRRTVTAAAVHGAARGVMDAFAPPDGQERAHFRGAA